MRQCGDCQLCCRLLPVKGVPKPALTRCKHQRHGKGCAVYHKPEKGFPWECGLWSCAWLRADPNGDAAALRRPDRAHYCIDILPDYITAMDPDGQNIVVPVVQVWVDPKYPDAHRDPALRAWLLCRTGFAAIIRYGADDAIILFPPYMMQSGEWCERTSNLQKETHNFRQVAEALGGT